MLEALFEREYHTLAQLTHPRIIEVYDYGLTDAGPYYTMELLDGRPARARAAAVAAKRAATCATWPRRSRCCTRVACVHRDVSPRNVR